MARRREAKVHFKVGTAAVVCGARGSWHDQIRLVVTPDPSLVTCARCDRAVNRTRAVELTRWELEYLIGAMIDDHLGNAVIDEFRWKRLRKKIDQALKRRRS